MSLKTCSVDIHWSFSSAERISCLQIFHHFFTLIELECTQNLRHFVHCAVLWNIDKYCMLKVARASIIVHYALPTYSVTQHWWMSTSVYYRPAMLIDLQINSCHQSCCLCQQSSVLYIDVNPFRLGHCCSVAFVHGL